MSSKTEISAQAIFVKELAARLQKDIESNQDKPSVYNGMANHTQLRSDIKRLRRELMELSNMIGYQYGR
jgi:hypothetical protein